MDGNDSERLAKTVHPYELGSFKLMSSKGFFAWLFGCVSVIALFFFQGWYPDAIGPLSNVLPASFMALVFVGAISCTFRYGLTFKTRFQSAWLSFALGAGLWLAAEIVWAAYYFVWQVDVPYPSAADFFYLGGYFPFGAGILLYLWGFRRGLTAKRFAVAGVAIAASVVTALWIVVSAELASNTSGVQFVVDLAYPVLDLSLLSLAVLSIAVFGRGHVAKWWALIAAGAGLYVIGDEYFLFQIAVGSYYNGSLDDLAFLLAYLTLALGFYTHRREL